MQTDRSVRRLGTFEPEFSSTLERIVENIHGKHSVENVHVEDSKSTVQ
jgi:hypothetical protein